MINSDFDLPHKTKNYSDRSITLFKTSYSSWPFTYPDDIHKSTVGCLRISFIIVCIARVYNERKIKLSLFSKLSNGFDFVVNPNRRYYARHEQSVEPKIQSQVSFTNIDVTSKRASQSASYCADI